MAVFARGILLPRRPWPFLSSARDFTSRCYKIGDEAEIRRVISIEDVQGFAHFTGDTNPIHLDENFAKKTRFGAVIVHGVILNGYVGSPGVEEFALVCTVVFVWTVHQTSVALCFNIKCARFYTAQYIKHVHVCTCTNSQRKRRPKQRIENDII